MPSLRILIISHEYPPFIYGGIGSFTHDLAHSLANKGADVTVFAGCPYSALKGPDLERTTVEDGLKVVRLPRLDFPPSHFWFQILNTNTIPDLLHEFDIIHGQDCATYPLISSCKRKEPKLPWVVTVHTDPRSELYYSLQSAVSSDGTIKEFASYVIAFPLWDSSLRGHSRMADALVGVSRDTCRSLSSNYNVDPQKLSTITTGVDIRTLERASRLALETHKQEASNKIRLLYAGRLYWRKGVLHLLKSLAHLKSEFGFDDFQLQVLGKGPLEQRVRESVTALGLGSNVTLRGFVDRNEFLRSMCTTDIACFPSLYEAFPVTMIEAMALGKPIVAFDRPFSREVLEGVTDIEKAKNVKDYAKQLHTLCLSRELREELGSQLHTQALKNYDMPLIADKYLELYGKITTLQ